MAVSLQDSYTKVRELRGKKDATETQDGDAGADGIKDKDSEPLNLPKRSYSAKATPPPSMKESAFPVMKLR